MARPWRGTKRWCRRSGRSGHQSNCGVRQTPFSENLGLEVGRGDGWARFRPCEEGSHQGSNTPTVMSSSQCAIDHLRLHHILGSWLGSVHAGTHHRRTTRTERMRDSEEGRVLQVNGNATSGAAPGTGLRSVLPWEESRSYAGYGGFQGSLPSTDRSYRDLNNQRPSKVYTTHLRI
jgi:hypothetical protein